MSEKWLCYNKILSLPKREETLMPNRTLQRTRTSRAVETLAVSLVNELPKRKVDVNTIATRQTQLPPVTPSQMALPLFLEIYLMLARYP
jgi:hypothetical protein